MKSEKIAYIVKCSTEGTYLRKTENKYGTNLNLSNYNNVEYYPSIDAARHDILEYCRKTKSKVPNMFEILELKITTEDLNSISPFPSDLKLSIFEFASCLREVPNPNNLDNITITKENIEDNLMERYMQVPKSFDFKIERNPSDAVYFAYINLSNIIW